MSRQRTLRIGTEHELLGKLEAAGLAEEDAQMIIASRGNKLAKEVVAFVRNVGAVTHEVIPATAWNTVQLGTHPSAMALAKAIDAQKGYGMSNWAQRILAKTPVASEPTSIDLYLISVKDLGHNQTTRRDTIYESAARLGFVSVPAEVGPQVLLQFGDQLAVNEWLTVAMEPIVDSEGLPRVFDVERSEDGCWLVAHYVSPGSEWCPVVRFLFRRK